MGKIKFLKGLSSAYNKITSKNKEVFYHTTDDNNVYLGDIKLSNGKDLDAAIERIKKLEAGGSSTSNNEPIELSKYTWSQLKSKCTNNDLKDLKVGDYKTITLTNGEKVIMEIAGIDTYYNAGDIACKHHIDWISRDCLKTGYKWTSKSNNNGVPSGTSGTGVIDECPYMISDIRNTLNSTIYNLLPSDLKSYITEKRSLLEIRANSGGTLTSSTSWSWRNLGKLWLPSEYEVFGSIVCGTKPWSAGQAVQYPIFANSWKKRIKGAGNGGARQFWWLTTVYDGHKEYVNIVDGTGFPFRTSPSNLYYVPICFRIGG